MCPVNDVPCLVLCHIVFCCIDCRAAYAIIYGDLMSSSVFCFRSIMCSKTPDKIHIWGGSLRSLCFRSLSVHAGICPLKGHFMTCFMSSGIITPVQFTWRYHEHLACRYNLMSLILRTPARLSLLGYMTIDA